VVLDFGFAMIDILSDNDGNFQSCDYEGKAER
jgi:hypothetical protein